MNNRLVLVVCLTVIGINGCGRGSAGGGIFIRSSVTVVEAPDGSLTFTLPVSADPAFDVSPSPKVGSLPATLPTAVTVASPSPLDPTDPSAGTIQVANGVETITLGKSNVALAGAFKIVDMPVAKATVDFTFQNKTLIVSFYTGDDFEAHLLRYALVGNTIVLGSEKESLATTGGTGEARPLFRSKSSLSCSAPLAFSISGQHLTLTVPAVCSALNGFLYNSSSNVDTTHVFTFSD